MDDVFNSENFIAQIAFAKTSGYATNFLTGVCDYILWYGKDRQHTKFRQPYNEKEMGDSGATKYTRIQLPDGRTRSISTAEKSGTASIPPSARAWVDDNLTSQGNPLLSFVHNSERFSGTYKTTELGLRRLAKAGRIYVAKGSFCYIRFIDDFSVFPSNAAWMDIGGVQSRTDPKVYVVQTATEAVRRCLIMSTDTGDLVVDPTCGAGTTAYVAEQWGRRWITIDTSRVALALARARLMGARYPYYLLADSRDGQLKEAEATGSAPSEAPTHGNIRQGFVYERVPHITLKSIANNAEIDVIYERMQPKVERVLEELNRTLKTLTPTLSQREREEEAVTPVKTGVQTPRTQDWTPADAGVTLEEWEVPHDFPTDWPEAAQPLHEAFWTARIERQREIDDAIAAKADYEYLYDKPYTNNFKVRVAGPFTVESLSPHRVLAVDENDEWIDGVAESQASYGEEQDFAQMILENLKTAGVQQAHKEDKINFISITPWPGDLVCAEGRYIEGDEETGTEKRAAIFIGPEFGTVSRPDLVAAAREAGDADFDALIACAFNYDAHSAEFDKLGRIPVLKARMKADLHMADDLKNTGKGNLFVIFGEPDIDILDAENGQVQVKVNDVDVFHPNTGEVRSDGAEGIACWFIDTDYNEESFFVRHAYFLGANDPYTSLKTTLKAEINEDAWATLNRDTSRPFDKPTSGRIAVKVINHLGDEVMKVFRVS